MMLRVGCAGILVSDTFCGPMVELPREGQLLALDDLPSKAGGCAANVAINLAKQGISVDVAGCLGKDSSAQGLLADLKNHNVDVTNITQTEEYSTSKTVILLVEGQDRRYIHSFGANRAFSVEHIRKEWLKTLDVFYLGGVYLLPSLDIEQLAELFGYCRENNVMTVVDVVMPQNTTDFEALSSLLSQTDYFLPNDDEAQVLTNQSDSFQQLQTLLKIGTRTVFITQGGEGVIAGSAGKWYRAGTYEMKTVDPSGSGDAFAAGVIVGALYGWDLPETLRYASALGASAVRRIGTTDGVFTAEQARQFIHDHQLSVSSANF